MKITQDINERLPMGTGCTNDLLCEASQLLLEMAMDPLLSKGFA